MYCPNCSKPVWALAWIAIRRFWDWLRFLWSRELPPHKWPEFPPHCLYKGASAYFEYTDAREVATVRRVDVTRVTTIQRRRAPNKILIEGFCHLRQEKRVFRVDRIGWCRIHPSWIPPEPEPTKNFVLSECQCNPGNLTICPVHDEGGLPLG